MLPVTVLLVVLFWGSIPQCQGREERIVHISQGSVRGYNEDGIITFYGIPYATAPTGSHKFRPPLPPPTWFNIFEADKMDVICPQYALPHIVTENMTVSENCLVANIFVPDTVEKNLPVLIYVHGGAFQLGYGNMYTYKALLLQSNKKFILINFYYRLGIHGFLCLGTEEVPGNAGMKDQVALLRWVRKNIASFGGNPYDVTIAGYSAGSASVELLMLSPAAKGLFNKVIPESGANMATFSVQVDPVKNARDFAKTFNFTDVDNIYALEEFYRTASFDILASDPFFEQKDSTFVFVPCVERKNVEETFLEECPYNILRTGRYDKVPLLHGFANMEGIARVISFDKWRHGMNEKFSNFLPADLQFDSAEEKEEVAKEIKEFYFGNKMVDEESILQYIDYFTDVLFANGHLRALKLHVAANHDKIYLYEYSFVDEEESKIPYTDSVRGAAHCAQTAAIVDGLAFSNKPENNASDDNKKMKSLMRELWSNFITTGMPVPAGSTLPAWPAVDASGAPHMSLGLKMELRGALMERRARFWDSVYQKHYLEPQSPPAPTRHTEL